MPSFALSRPVFAVALSLGLLSGLLAGPVAAQDQGFAGPYLAAQQASQGNDYAAAADYYARALVRDPRNPQILEAAILSFTNLGKLNRAVPVARQMQSTGQDSQIAQMILLADQLEKQEYTAALNDLDAGRTVGPLVDGLVRAWALLAAGDMEQSMAAFDAATTQTGLQAFGLYHKALAYATAGDFANADLILSGEAGGPLRLTRRGTFAHAQVLSQLGRNAAAIQLIDAAFGNDLDPGLAALRARLEAGETLPYDFTTDAKDGMAEVFYTVAGALNGEASDGYTLLYARIAQYLRPEHTDAILLAASLLEAQGQFTLATATYDRVPRNDPAFHSAEMGRAEALRRAGNTEAATEVLRQLTETHPQLLAVHVALGDVLRQQERYTEAVAAYDTAVALIDTPITGHWIVYYARGIANERTDHWDKAEADFRKALDLRPNQPQVLNYLGYSMIEMGVNLDEALKMIERAVAARPDSGYITDSLGWGLYKTGQYEDAVPYLERAAELMPVDPIVNDHLGDAFWAVGRKIEAQFQWTRALSFDPEEKDANRIRRKLEIGLDALLVEEGAPPLRVAQDKP